MGETTDQLTDHVVDMGTFDAQIEEAYAQYEASTDFTLGVEEEYALCDPESLDLVPEFERVHAAAQRTGLVQQVAGELLASEVEFRTGRCETWSQTNDELTTLRRDVSTLIDSCGLIAATSATHPWADYREQQMIDTPYYRTLVERMQYVARRNNTFGLHVHVGVQGADRAQRVCDALRLYQPMLLALSASSPFLDGSVTGMHSTRSMTFSRNFPRGNVAPAFGKLEGYLGYLRWLRDAGTIDSIGQIWWGTRPHIAFGTVELRMFDGQPDVRDTLALTALAQGLVAHLCRLHDAGELPEPQPEYLLDENMWRAARYGTDADLIQLPTSATLSARHCLEQLHTVARDAAAEAGLDCGPGLDRAEQLIEAGCSADWQLETFRQTGSLHDAYRAVAEEVGS